jgi:DNA adenine methylase
MPPTNYLEDKIRSTHRWHGGKAHIARRIVDLITDHETYLEPFAGGANVLLNKYRAHREVICDLHEELIYFYRYLVNNTDLFVEKIKSIPFSKESFLWSKEVNPGNQDPLERALKFFVKHNMSRGGMGQDYSDDKDDPRRRNLAAWETYQEDLLVTADRLRGTEIRLQNAFEALDEFSQDPGALTYLDPPYYPSTRVSSQVYLHEMTAFDHLRLLKKVKEFSGKVIISGYANPTYDQELADWDRVVIAIANSSSQKKVKPVMEEVIWIKPWWPF